MLKRAFYCLIVLALLSGCASKKPASRYHVEQDYGPTKEVDLSTVPDAVPRLEPLSKRGNMESYVVRGKRYRVMSDATDFSETCYASWYGAKFHGHETSNGERYNMYAMTAAHKHLPLPTYVKVTNLENDLSTIVRVNDRGPFHEGRVIDLSYAAASKLGFAKKGTARVRVEVVDPRYQNVESDENTLALFIQLGAFGTEASAARLRDKAEPYTDEPIFIARAEGASPVVYRVRVGPFVSRSKAEQELAYLKKYFGPDLVLITRALADKAK